jgi:superfamily I DNA/RNA helicase
LATRSPVLAARDDDQAIYGWRHASPQFIREMATGGDWEVFDLPFCSRCTPVVVAAVHDLIDRACREGLFQDRLEKAYECYLPDKAGDAER